MTTSEAYEFLDSIRRMEAEIMKKQLQHDELRSCLLPAGIRYDLDKVQSSPSDRMSVIEAKVVDLGREIEDLKMRKAKLIVEVNAAVTQLGNDTEEIILLGFYVGRLPARRLADMLHYTVRGIYKAKRRAVIHLAQKCSLSSPSDSGII